MTRLEHEDLWFLEQTLRQGTPEARVVGELVGFNKSQCEQFVAILDLKDTKIQQTIGGVDAHGYSIVFLDPNAVYEDGIGIQKLTIRNKPGKTAPWLIWMIAEQRLSIELSGSIEKKKITEALEALGFEIVN